MSKEKLPKIISYYGSKYRIAKHYPEPMHGTIIEPFAGSAGYALTYSDLQVSLYDVDPKVCRVWDFVIKSKPEEILSLPLLRSDQSIEELNIQEEAKLLIGWWLGAGTSQPRKRYTKNQRYALTRGWASTWTEKRRALIAHTSSKIKHWNIYNESFQNTPNIEATWFIDPPYQSAGNHYRYFLVDYNELGLWCKSQKGQVIVCENEHSNSWLPFKPLCMCKGTIKHTQEVIWTNRGQ